jgi:hypothetical protein
MTLLAELSQRLMNGFLDVNKFRMVSFIDLVAAIPHYLREAASQLPPLCPPSHRPSPTSSAWMLRTTSSHEACGNFSSGKLSYARVGAGRIGFIAGVRTLCFLS